MSGNRTTPFKRFRILRSFSANQELQESILNSKISPRWTGPRTLPINLKLSSTDSYSYPAPIPDPQLLNLIFKVIPTFGVPHSSSADVQKLRHWGRYSQQELHCLTQRTTISVKQHCIKLQGMISARPSKAESTSFTPEHLQLNSESEGLLQNL